MVHLGWSPPAQPVDIDSARHGIQAQHIQIRRLLYEARDLAERALDGVERQPDAVASAIGDIRTAIEVHLSFEEGVLVPLFRLDGPEGESRVIHLLDEHRRQRATLAQLHLEANTSPRLPMLPAKLAFLTTWLLTDMAEEERRLQISPL